MASQIALRDIDARQRCYMDKRVLCRCCEVNEKAVVAKFGAPYRASARTLRMGIDQRFATHIAQRFQGQVVLETCTGGGFTTIALARVARHVFSVDIDKDIQDDAQHNVCTAGVADAVTFIHADAFDVDLEGFSPHVEAILIDPDWADSGPDHEYKFIRSTTQPPSDAILKQIMGYTMNITLIQPPFIAEHQFSHLPEHETESLYMNGNHELYCLHFGFLAGSTGATEYRI